ncbi:DNA phosphorothioation-dependent restriction protein DptG [Salegentibacter sp. LM13S]|uniref:DNA phosphorothioation-dependent restriction protein DptG n=1 Tax=Salegentibacter lacus TaxID=2873599 RepID=UPI001CC92606|nr:DNA phosphorothioation-dependent restriction protein DptG [Salegentibacter lacus]MBZ9631390.1 DNA phosphorothioation-dependent restriction protein DptG [Salegentibacter lacus]
MKEVTIEMEGIDGLISTYINKDKWRGHLTGNKFKILPFKTKFSQNCMPDLRSFHGVVGECFRISRDEKFSKELNGNKKESFNHNLRDFIIDNVQKEVNTKHFDRLKDVIINLFFEDDHSLIKFSKDTLPYLNFFIQSNHLEEISYFVYSIFLKGDILKDEDLTKSTNDNLLYKLVLESLPDLEIKTGSNDRKEYKNIFPQIKDLFQKDFKFIASSEELYLNHIQDLYKYYFFFYLSQLARFFNSFGADKEIKPIYFSMDWETLSASRLAYLSGWVILKRDSNGLFSHIFTLELLNYILVANDSIGDYFEIQETSKSLATEEKTKLIESIRLISEFYKGNISKFYAGYNWEKCENEVAGYFLRNPKKYNCEVQKEIIRLYKLIKYQFDHSERGAAHERYGKWFEHFCKINFVKNRGRLGGTTVLNQEYLLFLTKLCIGKKDKIRLNELWHQLRLRGLVFDETSKGEIIKLFEKINLLEKKSDSGDAQYVKSTI